MTPSGGFYTILHLLIISTVKLAKSLKSRILPVVIFFSILLLTLYNLTNVFRGSFNKLALADIYDRLTEQCQPVSQGDRPNKIILRLDDIQAVAWRDVQFKILDELKRRGLPVLLGVIPKGIEQDKRLYDYLKRNSCHLEIGLHGWDQGREEDNSAEFANLSQAQAYEKIMLGKPILEAMAGGQLTTFVPPNNKYSRGTAAAVLKSGMKIITAEGGRPFDYTASTYQFDKQRLVPNQEIIEACQRALNEKQLCLVMVHPQDFASQGRLDQAKYSDFLQLLDELSQLDASFVTPRDLQYWYHLWP